ncbi:bifunctional riboflavin kinase/FMN phosphatase-like isoform X3 [Macadamia integrifolia]|uniref:bifunctional riboflavin kinase/FMN phosphatase-like isoform X3 n=1 Tax=Macadamia integrifolia TaxID=60698 RepID=UPI001C4E4B82|nr:bifunctional riboflavin kinase/FMN phosphatase-like isoform X3 [Macadamia integrifolia]
MNYLALWMKLYQNLIHRSLIRLEGTLPLEPWHIGGPVVKGFGRGSKEPWIPHDFDEDFYGEELCLNVIGYKRPEANFPTLESLIAKIH